MKDNVLMIVAAVAVVALVWFGMKSKSKEAPKRGRYSAGSSCPNGGTCIYVDGTRLRFINLTPHAINLLRPSGEIVIPSDGNVRVATQSEPVVGDLIYRTSFGAVDGLPAPALNTYYIVSRLVIQAAPDRDDLVAPGELVRDESGRIVGAKNLSF